MSPYVRPVGPVESPYIWYLDLLAVFEIFNQKLYSPLKSWRHFPSKKAMYFFYLFYYLITNMVKGRRMNQLQNGLNALKKTNMVLEIEVTIIEMQLNAFIQ